jgi:hypothetical protein
MSSITVTTQQGQETQSPGYALKVDFSWMKWKALITEKDGSQSKSLYIIDYKTLQLNLVFKSASDNSTFGTGTSILFR